jgi:fatty-acyl-CoA synthase
MFNFDGRMGAIGRAPRYLRSQFNIRLIRFDVEKEEPIRGPDGLCQECRPGEIGECVGQISDAAREAYSGYADKAASDKKVLHDVFRRGDAFFATGDLMRQDRDGYFYFVDRIGDTFRWKGENVSTTEVSGCLSEVEGVKEANVYGVAVPGYDGRAGMASLVVDESFDIAKLQAHAESCLPPYAQPIFLRLSPEIETTGTLKYRKIDLVAQGFDPKVIKSPVFMKHPEKGYIPLDAALYRRIAQEKVKL